MSDRFTIIGNPDLVVKPINPAVSYAPRGKRTENFSKSGKAELEIYKLYTLMQLCASGKLENTEKGAQSMHVYKSTRKGVKPYVFDGVICVDIDKFDEYDGLRGKQHVIFDRFADLCQEMKNLLCIKYSPSGNLHFYIYHSDIKDDYEYSKLSRTYLCCLCKVIKSVIGVDLRDYKGAIDTHLCNADWQLNINDSPVKWNIMCSDIKLTKKQIDILKAEYGEFMRMGERKLTTVASTITTGDGEQVVNDEFVIHGYNGYFARTAIVAAAYFHFKQDLDATKDWLKSMYKNAPEMEKQLNNMVENNTISRKYETSVEKILFGNSDKDVIMIPEDKYLSDVVDDSTFTSKYEYCNAGTGVGKTELVKNIIKRVGADKIAILQMNKALRDGKKQGIEPITQDNFMWDSVVSKDRIHATIEGFLRNCDDIDISEYIIIIDEAHLLQDYSAIDGKFQKIADLLSIINDAKQIIFMSATPKFETKLFPFQMKKFVKMKKQTLNIFGHPLKYAGKGSKEATRYSKMINYIRAIDGKHIIFSNKHQECWKKYGIKDIDYTWFHSQNYEDAKVQSVLNDNKLLTDITLATNYLGVGVEIKHEQEVHIWFDLSEGWDKSFVEQAIGRPRDAENINLHLFYTVDSNQKAGLLSEEEIEAIENAFEALVIDIDGLPTVNIVAAKMTGIYDVNFNTYKSKDKVKILKIGQIVSNKDYFTINDIDLLRQLPYNEINVRHNDTYILNTDGKERYVRAETQLKQHLISRTNNWWMDIRRNNTTYEFLLSELDTYWDDKKNAQKMLSDCKYVWNGAIDLTDADGFFDSMNLACNVMHDVSDYCNVKAGTKVVSDFVGAEKTMEKVKTDFKRVETAFTKDYLDYRIDCILLNKSARPDVIEMNNDDELLTDIMGIDNITIHNNTDTPYPFRTNSWKAALNELKPETNKENAKKGGAKKTAIKLINETTNEVLEFASKGDCMKHFNINSRSFSKYLKGGNVKQMKNWKILTVEHS